MEPRLIKLSGPSLEVLRSRVLAEHGEHARLLEANRVTVGGVAGFLARRHYEVTVQLPPPPVPLSAPGSLVLVAGLGEDAVEVCASMAAAAGYGAELLRAAGLASAPGIARADDRREAERAQAEAVLGGRPVYVAMGLPGETLRNSLGAAAAAALGPDQVWAAVDAGRKADDTAQWVAALQDAVHVDAVALFGLDGTSSPGTAAALGIPVGWTDGPLP
ncbi:MAG: hypothetical protein ABTA24_00590 [Arthrobacter sp.]